MTPLILKRRSRRNWLGMLRPAVQVTFVVFILVASVRHALLEGTTPTASIDALCPLGGLETLWTWLTTGGYVSKIHQSSLVLGLGLLLGTLLAGAGFCGWICPLGSLQDGLTWLRTRLGLRELRVPAPVDRWLRYGRFVSLALILGMTISTATLWFADYDPYRTLFGLGWLFEFDLAAQWPAYLVTLAVLGLSFFIPRFWCKYTCPLGGALSLVGHLSLFRIRRNAASCKGCLVCETPCPVGIKVASAGPAVSPNCIGCLACVDACPRHATLEVRLAPTWLDSLKALTNRKPLTLALEEVRHEDQ